jgi:hypothetical protein
MQLRSADSLFDNSVINAASHDWQILRANGETARIAWRAQGRLKLVIKIRRENFDHYLMHDRTLYLEPVSIPGARAPRLIELAGTR